jgi:invasion protein IalB
MTRCLGEVFALGRAGLPLVAALFAADASAQAQAQTSRAPHLAQAQSMPVPAPAASGRTEILTYDNWTVTCRDGRDAKEKRVCTAELDIFQEANNTRRAVFTWLIGLNKDGAPVTAMRFPPGVAIAPGLVLKFADRPARNVPMTSCEPSHCEASTTMDEAFMRDAQAVQQAETVLTASDGRQVTFTINMKGFSQALAAVRK